MLLRRYHTVVEVVKEPAIVEKPVFEKIENEDRNMTVKELKEVAKEKEVKGYSTMSKKELLEVLAGE